MKEVVSTSAVFFSYALLAIFAQNAVFTRALGVSRMVQLVGDDRTSSALFGMMLCITQVLVAPVAFFAMRWFCPFYFLLSILHGLAGAVRGTGASIPPMVVLLVSLCLFRVVWIQFLLPFFPGIEGVFILYPVSWGLGAVLMILYAWKGKWMEYHT